MNRLLFFAAMLTVAEYGLCEAKPGKGSGKDKKNRVEKGYSTSTDFFNWAAKQNKTYKTTDGMNKHKDQYNKSKKAVEGMNEKAKGKKAKVKFELNFFADVLDDEMEGYKGAFTDEKPGEFTELPEFNATGGQGRSLQEEGDIPIDWRRLGHLTPVRDQTFGCGSCVPLSMATTMEALISIQKTARNGGYRVPPKKLSEQHLIDCAQSYGNYGCGGGWIRRYSDFIIDEGVVPYEKYRPYEAKNGVCEHNDHDVVAKASARGQILTTIQDAIKQLHKGPMPVSMSQSCLAFLFYSSGILGPDDGCLDSDAHNHAVTIVGYGVEDVEKVVQEAETKLECRSASRSERRGRRCYDNSILMDSTQCCSYAVVPEQTETVATPYWLIQNTWGETWGEDGFIKIEVTGGMGVCGINRNLQWIDL